VWRVEIGAIETELAERKEGYRQAALAHLTLLLIDIARLAGDVVGDLKRSGEPLLAEVFTVIDRGLGEPLSLRDVAHELGITPGHLTTVVRHRTGRTVQEWIIERRMAEARSLLSGTELPVGEIARRVGMADPGYFSRLFRRTHCSSRSGTSPRPTPRTKIPAATTSPASTRRSAKQRRPPTRSHGLPRHPRPGILTEPLTPRTHLT
jgi:AraC family transcriptional regulator, transcriptional activator of pobA